MEEIFEQFFGGGLFGGLGRRAGRLDIQTSIEISFLEAAKVSTPRAHSAPQAAAAAARVGHPASLLFGADPLAASPAPSNPTGHLEDHLVWGYQGYAREENGGRAGPGWHPDGPDSPAEGLCGLPAALVQGLCAPITVLFACRARNRVVCAVCSSCR